MGIGNMVNNLVNRAVIRLENVAIGVGLVEVYDSRGRRIKRPKSALRASRAIRAEAAPPPPPPPPPAPAPAPVIRRAVAVMPYRQRKMRRRCPGITPRRPRLSR